CWKLGSSLGVLTVFGKFPIGFGLFLVTCDHMVEKHDLTRVLVTSWFRRHRLKETSSSKHSSNCSYP
ncbi:Uncharacterized protein APZ42_004997, partial [Daphnia magna]